MDTDGFVDKTHIEYYTVSKELSIDVLHLLRSLGINCRVTDKETSYKNKITSKKIDCKKCYRISVYTDKEIFNLDRKQNLIKNHTKSKQGQSKYYKTTIVNIEPIGERVGQCIAVDNEDHTYVVKDHIVTHNSFWYSSLLGHSLLFDGRVINVPSNGKQIISENFAASGESTKSGELLAKMKTALDRLNLDPELGCYLTPDVEGYQPHPFSKNFVGTLKEGNGKNAFRHEYKIKAEKGGYKTKTGSKLVHGIITIDNPETSAGTRNDITVVEEVGLISNIRIFHGSNRATQIADRKYGSTFYLGTSGNMKKIMDTKYMFQNPGEFELLAFKDTYEYGNDIGFFLPCYVSSNNYKDNQGNTDVEAGKEYYMHQRSTKKDEQLVLEIMNYPIYPSEMFVTTGYNVLPSASSKKLVDKLSRHKIGTPVRLFKRNNEIDYEVVNKQLVPYPYKTQYNAEGPIWIYDFPIKEKIKRNTEFGVKYDYKVPNDAYLFGFDPYATDTEKDSRNSLGATYVMLSPAYYHLATSRNIVVASLIARYGRRKDYLEQLELLMEMYGNPVRGLWYENDRGDHVKSYFERKNKLHLLGIDKLDQRTMKRAVGVKYGWQMGNGIKKFDRIDSLGDFLRQETEMHGKVLTNLERIPDWYLHAEIMNYDIDSKANYDRLIGLLGCVVGVNNLVNERKTSLKRKNSDGTVRSNYFATKFKSYYGKN